MSYGLCGGPVEVKHLYIVLDDTMISDICSIKAFIVMLYWQGTLFCLSYRF